MKRTLAILTPTLDAKVYAGYMRGIFETSYYFGKNGWEMMIVPLTHFSILHTGRNLLVEVAKVQRATDFLFVDADVAFTVNDVLALWNAPAQFKIVGGFYPTKEDNGKVNISAPKDRKLKIHGNRWLETNGGNTGFLLIKREVFDAVRERDPDTQHIDFTHGLEGIDGYDTYFDFSYSGEPGKRCVEGEDINFCRKAYKLGYSTFLDMSVSVGHWGGKEWRVPAPQEAVQASIRDGSIGAAEPHVAAKVNV